jgi:hypothetical protein
MIIIANAYAIEHPDEIAQNLVNTGTPSTSLIVEQQDLEEHFLQLTEKVTGFLLHYGPSYSKYLVPRCQSLEQ